MPVLREGRMVGHVTLEPKAAEPAVCQIEVNLFAQAPLRTDADAVADQQHSDHQLGGDRGAPDRAVKGRQLPPQPIELHEPVNRAQQMIGRNVPLKRKLVEQRSLLTQPMSHHDSVPSLRLNQRTSTGASVPFFNKIGPKPTSEPNRTTSLPASGNVIGYSRRPVGGAP